MNSQIVTQNHAGLALGTVAGVDVKGALIGAALGALAMHFYGKSQGRKHR